jgi:hypothetical protein
MVSRRRRGAFEAALDTRPLARPTTGPRPSNFVAMVERSTDQPSYVYVLRFGSSEIWKIGHAEDPDARLCEIARHVPDELIGANWSLFAKYACSNVSDAYQREQALLAALRHARTVGERIACPPSELVAAWRQICCLTPAEP